ncbi:alpha/beta hydrolase fold domain-containing protein [Kineococcus sp. SYSU DK006]|uniref:alpha/beta hydrolase fold domain-containing protein n=1 Tax=Kineococcus sp. SYSU DK006 TaxID=3383127 RepID=UPI003D7F049F
MCAVAALLLSSCSSGGAPAERLPVDDGPGVEVVEGITYWQGGSESLDLDACLPREATTPLPALVVVHGGGFTSGSRTEGGSRGLCETLATQGIAGFSIDYRMAPAHTYPDQVDDVSRAVEWLRRPEQVERFGVDPARLGLLGSSAGAVLALTVGTAGSGPTDSGARVKTVVSLSGVADFRPQAGRLGDPGPEATQLVLNYLGCASPADCPVAAEASPVTRVDPSDPPVLLVNGTRELVPSEQVDAMAAALEAAGVAHRELLVDGDSHGTSLLRPDVRQAVRSFLKETL